VTNSHPDHPSLPDSWTLNPIGWVRSPFREKFGIPRQPGLAPHALSRLVLSAQYATPGCLDGLQAFSHIWLIFAFHGTAEQGWQPQVRPPRLGGNEYTGVFSTRTMFRPNPVGLSVVELIGIEPGEQGLELLLRGADMLDGTPVLDIKPYVPYVDSVPQARAAFAQDPPPQLPVQWTETAYQVGLAMGLTPDQFALIEEVLAQDPRPAYRGKNQDTRSYGVWLQNYNVRFTVDEGGVTITGLAPRAG